MNITDMKFGVEEFIDKFGLIAVIDAVAETCYLKAQHLEENWQDKPAARRWTRAGNRVNAASAALVKIGASASD